MGIDNTDDPLFEPPFEEEEKENLLELILRLMQTDDDNLDRQSSRLRNAYEQADKDGKELLDDALLCICGYSLATLIKETYK